ncbi:hypothetical protein B0T16DRAFT_416911 [Cercophora newfieldiana]|uniref:C2H2-type domain-containing protein n=1 Tax=Cercophora newfieldiana TaxID=92897 RepID=A0AA39Y0W6_9PEZI|nr:hypothetical protein B0T16DRAFT_416911 [Cercophora newfieldiana]
MPQPPTSGQHGDGSNSQRTHQTDDQGRTVNTATPRLFRDAIERALSDTIHVEERSKKMYDKFLGIIQASPALSIERDLGSAFPTPEAWLTKGKDTWEAILKGARVDNLPGILAFTSLAYVVSTLWVDTGRMEEHDVLPDLHLLRYSIRNLDESRLFASLVDGMCELSFSSRQKLHWSPQFRGRTLLDTAYGLACLSEENSDFAQFLTLSNAISKGVIPHLSGPPCVNPRDLIAGRSTSTVDPLEALDIEPERWAPPRFASRSGSAYKFEISENPRKDPEPDLRNTVSFLVVLSFLKAHSSVFFTLSGQGKSVARWGGSYEPTAQSTFKRATALRENFFRPLKTAMKATTSVWNLGFGALLSVAKSFVVRGKFQTRAEVLDYLQGVSAEFVGPQEQQRFMQWISTVIDQPPDRKRREMSPASNDAPKAKRERVMEPKSYPCSHCDKSFTDPSNLQRHMVQHQPPESRPKHDCGWPGCGKSFERSDARLRHWRTHSKSVVKG